MIVVGVDENGLGPQLGPLIATAVTVEVVDYDAAGLREVAMRAGIGDSKQTTGFGQMAVGESLALAVVESLTGNVPKDMDALLDALSIDSVAILRAPCPATSATQCWSEALALPVFGGEVNLGRTMLAALAKEGVRLHRARTAVHCAGRLNRDFAQGISKLVVDLSLFERLVLDARGAVSEDVLAHCGMVGGMRKYPGYFRHFDPAHATPLSEVRGTVAYAVAGVGEVRFEVSADDNHMVVSLASMIGKYVRELSMERQNRFYARNDATLPTPSGYHDPVTARFVTQSEALRRKLDIADACFARTR